MDGDVHHGKSPRQGEGLTLFQFIKQVSLLFLDPRRWPSAESEEASGRLAPHIRTLGYHRISLNRVNFLQGMIMHANKIMATQGKFYRPLPRARQEPRPRPRPLSPFFGRRPVTSSASAAESFAAAASLAAASPVASALLTFSFSFCISSFLFCSRFRFSSSSTLAAPATHSMHLCLPGPLLLSCAL